MQKQQIPLKNSLFLLLAAVIWGIAFVAQSVGMDYVGGFTFNAVRSLIGSAVLVPLILIPGQENFLITPKSQKQLPAPHPVFAKPKRSDHRRYFLRDLPLSGK